MNTSAQDQAAIQQHFSTCIASLMTSMQELLGDHYKWGEAKSDHSYRNVAGLLDHLKEDYGSQFKLIEVEFGGSLRGLAFMILSQEGSSKLAKSLLEVSGLVSDGLDADELYTEMLTELGNVALNAAIGVLADGVKSEVLTKVPSITNGITQYSCLAQYARPSDDHLLYSAVEFCGPTGSSGICYHGHLGMILETASLTALATSLR